MRDDVRADLMDQIRDLKEEGYDYNKIEKILGVKISKIGSIKSKKGSGKRGKAKKNGS